MRKTLFLAGALLLGLSSFARAESIWADILNDWHQGPNAQYAIPTSLSPEQERTWVADRVLGPSDLLGATTWDATKETFFNLGDGSSDHNQGFVDISFSKPILLGAGADLAVYEFGGYGTGIAEDAGVRVQIAGPVTLQDLEFTRTSWSIVGKNYGGSQLNELLFDLGDSGLVSRLRVYDIKGAYQGADIDAIKGLVASPEPVSTTLFLLGGVPLAAAFLRKKKSI